MLLTDDDDDDDSSDDVDVVSVGPTPISVNPLQSQSSSNSLRDLLVLPPSTSMLAQVTAMHNYSSVPAPCDGSTSASGAQWPRSRCQPDDTLRRLVKSAPHSPVSHGRIWRQKMADEELRSLSMPNSPAAGSASRRSQLICHRRRSVAAPRGGCSDSEDLMSPSHRRPGTGGKRALHNVLERRRRDHLKWNFEALRSVVPSAAGNARMPKVAILRRARDHVRHLRAIAEKLEGERNRLRSLHQRWQHKLALIASCE